MKTLILVLFGNFLFSVITNAQFTRYIVRLKNKGGTPFSISSPTAFLSQKSIDRRTKYGIAIDSTDLPVNPSYVSQIDNVSNVTVLNVSKWQNSIAIQTTDVNAINTINSLPFVLATAPIAARVQSINTGKLNTNEQPYSSAARNSNLESDFFNYGSGSLSEINLHKGQFLHNIGMRGQGMFITLLDGGFFNYNTLDAMDSIIANNQVKDTWDFVSNNATVSDDHPHGMECLSIIAANLPGTFIGKAPKANFLLYRTEDVSTEYPIEEFNMVCGMERADSAGTDVISVSLGYTEFDNPSFSYSYSNMNGNTTISVMGADLAAKKGMLFVVSAGNDGSSPWHYISTPADGDSVLTVGAVNTSGAVGSFSSYGPSSDGRVKPDVASVGVSALIQSTSNTIVTGSGTSFACPNMAGLAAILWQAFPEVNNMKIIKTLRETGSIATLPNDRIGYGIPDLKKAFSILLTEFATSSSSLNECKISVSWTSKDVQAMKYELERKAPGELSYTKIADINPLNGSYLSIHNYEYINTVATGTSGLYSFRIRQIIDTAIASFTAVYIDTTTLTISSPCVVTGGNGSGKNIFLIKPNPATGSIATLVIETTDAISNMPLLIYDMNGRLVIRMQKSKAAGLSAFDLPIGKLAKGKYIIKVFNNSKAIGTAEMIKL